MARYDVVKITLVLNPLVRAPRATDLAAPVGTFMRPTLMIDAVDSLSRGAQTLRENGAGLLPVLDETGKMAGVLSDAGLARALAEASEPTDAVSGFIEAAETIAPYASAAEALRRGEDGRTLVVVDDGQRPVGLISAVDLWPRRRSMPRPAMVGGMATPFGVYLTTGTVSAGAPWWALAASGAAMFSMLIASDLASAFAVSRGLPVAAEPYLAGLVFFGLMRLVPLSGVHGAEHQVVNAIEREEALHPGVVRRMPLVHPRCGTNLMVGIAVFGATLTLGQGSHPTADTLMVRVFPAVLLGVVFARPLGSVVQRFVTTKRPSDRQLANALRAGEALLLANATARQSSVNPFRRIWCMGLLQVMAGAVGLAGLLAVLKAITHLSWLPDFNR